MLYGLLRKLARRYFGEDMARGMDASREAAIKARSLGASALEGMRAGREAGFEEMDRPHMEAEAAKRLEKYYPPRQ